MHQQQAASISDLRILAKKHLPRFAFDFIDGGADDELNLRKNSAAFDAIEIVPRYLNDVSQRHLSVSLFGKEYAVPFGMAPIGFLNMAWPGADMMVAKLAAEKRFPHVISTASSTRLETIAEAAQGYAWFQLYHPANNNIYGGLLERAKAAGIDVLMLTVDVSSPGKRDRDIRNQLRIPFHFSPGIIASIAWHPRWALATLRAGSPDLANILPYADDGSRTLAQMQAELISASVSWDDLDRLRNDWQGTLLVKGLMHPNDAQRAIELGCDGLVVSNHGGRQASFAPSSISMLPAIARATNGAVPLLLDSGIRRGADILRAKVNGADMVLAGRPFAYGAAAARDAGVNRAFEILHTELDRAVGQIGSTNFHSIEMTSSKQ